MEAGLDVWIMVGLVVLSIVMELRKKGKESEATPPIGGPEASVPEGEVEPGSAPAAPPQPQPTQATSEPQSPGDPLEQLLRQAQEQARREQEALRRQAAERARRQAEQARLAAEQARQRQMAQEGRRVTQDGPEIAATAIGSPGEGTGFGQLTEADVRQAVILQAIFNRPQY